MATITIYGPDTSPQCENTLIIPLRHSAPLNSHFPFPNVVLYTTPPLIRQGVTSYYSLLSEALQLSAPHIQTTQVFLKQYLVEWLGEHISHLILSINSM